MELSKLQKSIIEAPYNKIVVMASASSGKTRLLTEKTRSLLRAGIDPHEIAVITFTNMAAAELRQRLGNDYKDGLFVGTIHSLANYFLLSAGIDTKDYLNEENFDKLFDLVANNPYCIRKITYLILDEAQDTDKLQFKFLLDMINPPNFFFAGDVRQSIYQWKGARPDLLLELMKKIDVKVFDMNENYRNGANILVFAKRLIRPTGLEDTSIAMNEDRGSVVETGYADKILLDYLKKEENYKNWAVLTRTNNEVGKISILFRKNGIPYDTFKQGDLTKDELLDKMEKNTVKVLTVHSAKGLEWENVAVMGMRYYNNEERNICYVAATRAKKKLVWFGYVIKEKKSRYSF